MWKVSPSSNYLYVPKTFIWCTEKNSWWWGSHNQPALRALLEVRLNCFGISGMSCGEMIVQRLRVKVNGATYHADVRVWHLMALLQMLLEGNEPHKSPLARLTLEGTVVAAHVAVVLDGVLVYSCALVTLKWASLAVNLTMLHQLCFGSKFSQASLASDTKNLVYRRINLFLGVYPPQLSKKCYSDIH